MAVRLVVEPPSLGAASERNSSGWKLCHIEPVGLGRRGETVELPLNEIEDHFRRLMSPRNMFVVPKNRSGLGELPEMLEAVRRENERPKKMSGKVLRVSDLLPLTFGAGIGGYITRDALPGGKGQEFFSRIMVRVRKGETIGDQKSPQGFFIEMKAEKNKTHTPLLTSSVPFYYTGLPDPIYEAFMMASDLGIVVRSGPQYAYPDKETGEVVYKALGREKFLQLMKDNEGLRTSIEAEIRSME